MLKLVEVQSSLPSRIAGTEVHHWGDEPPDVWYAWDNDEYAWVCRDLDGEEVFTVTFAQLVGVAHLNIDWTRCAESPHKVRFSVQVYEKSAARVS